MLTSKCKTLLKAPYLHINDDTCKVNTQNAVKANINPTNRLIMMRLDDLHAWFSSTKWMLLNFLMSLIVKAIYARHTIEYKNDIKELKLLEFKKKFVIKATFTFGRNLKH